MEPLFPSLLRSKINLAYVPVKGGVRFAPSPTGRFHLGNLRSAWVASQWAKQLGQNLVFRFEDIDRARVIVGAREQQLEDVSALGIQVDNSFLQTQFAPIHEAIFSIAVSQDLVYPCSCSRKEVALHLSELASAPHGKTPLYDGRCRDRNDSHVQKPEIGWRYRDPQDSSGQTDFLIGRSPWLKGGGKVPEMGTFEASYQWACALDDYFGEYDLIVRAWDLEDATNQQRALFSLFDQLYPRTWKAPAVFHTSLIVHDTGHRLEKRSRGVTLDEFSSSDQIIKKFQDSFAGASRKEMSPSRVWGEVKKILTLSELGFR